MKEQAKKILSNNIFLKIFSLIIGIQFVIGYFLQENNILFDNFKIAIGELALILIISLTVYFLLKLIRHLLKKIHLDKFDNKILKLDFLHYFTIIIVCWIPVFIAFYPAIFSYDGPDQVLFSIGNTIENPILHTALLKLFTIFGIKYLKSLTIGLALYCIFQSVFLALCFAITCDFINKRYKNKIITICSILFFAIFPLNQLFPFITTKDTIFAGLFLLFMICTFIIKQNSIDSKKNIIECLIYLIITILVCNFRTNSKYAILAYIVFLIVKSVKNRKKDICIFVLISGLIINFLINYICLLIWNNKSSIKQTFFLQHIYSQIIANDACENDSKLTEFEITNINLYYKDYKKLEKSYHKHLSDRANKLLYKDAVLDNKVNYIKFVIHMITKYPSSSIKAVLNVTRGYWYLEDNSFDNIYPEREKIGALELYTVKIYTHEEVVKLSKEDKYNSFTYYKNSIPDSIRIKESNLLPKLKGMYMSLFAKNEYRKIPIIGKLFTPAVYFYLVLLYFIVTIYKKKNVEISFLLLVYFITCLLGPCAILRYIYNIIVCAPLIIMEMVAMLRRKNEKVDE